MKMRSILRNRLIATAACLIIALSLVIVLTPNKRAQSEPIRYNQASTLEDWEQRYKDVVKTLTVEITAETLPPDLHHPGIEISKHVPFPESGWIIGYRPEVLDGPSHALHHADTLNLSYPSPFCGGELPYVVMSSGKELTSGFLPTGYGIPVHQGDDIQTTAMYHNPTHEPYENVTAKLTFWYIPYSETTNIEDVHTLFLDATGPCHHGIFSIDANSVHTETMKPKYRLEHTGRVVTIGTHSHDYSENIELNMGRRSITVEPETSESGEIISLPVLNPDNLYLQKGDMLSISTTYHNPTDATIMDAMGKALLFIDVEGD